MVDTAALGQAVDGSLHPNGWWLIEHCNGDGAGLGHEYACGRGDRARTGWGGGGGGKPSGIVTKNEASPLPLNKALRKLKSFWSNFAIKAKSAHRL